MPEQPLSAVNSRLYGRRAVDVTLAASMSSVTVTLPRSPIMLTLVFARASTEPL